MTAQDTFQSLVSTVGCTEDQLRDNIDSLEALLLELEGDLEEVNADLSVQRLQHRKLIDQMVRNYPTVYFFLTASRRINSGTTFNGQGTIISTSKGAYALSKHSTKLRKIVHKSWKQLAP